MRILVISQCSLVDHRGHDATDRIVKEIFFWKGMSADIREFVHACIHGMMTRAGEIVPRPLGSSLHGIRPNEVVHKDFMYMGSGVEELKVRRHFPTAYSPCANGTVEPICREVLRSCKVLLSEWHLTLQDWPALVECIQSILNHSPLKRLGNRSDGVYRTSLQVFTGIKPIRPLTKAFPASKYRAAHSDNELNMQKLINIQQPQEKLSEMHKQVHKFIRAARAKDIIRHNEQIKVVAANFQIGDIVLVRRPQKKGHKRDSHGKGHAESQK